MKKRPRIRYRVFAAHTGEVAFVNAFSNPAEAARLTHDLRDRYGGQKVKVRVWYMAEDFECTTSWSVMRATLPARSDADVTAARRKRHQRVLERRVNRMHADIAANPAPPRRAGVSFDWWQSPTIDPAERRPR